MKFKKIAILGPGLLGGSLALSAVRHGLAETVALWARREEAVAQIRSRNIVACASTELEPVVNGADLVVFATPVGIMPNLAQAILPHISPGAIVTDVGSVKARVVAQLEPIIQPKAFFVGSHPMAGTDKTGMEHATAHLFDQAACILTPTENTDAEACRRLAYFWETVQCRVFFLSPEEHDRAVALVSHMPHLTAAALVNATVSAGGENGLNLAGPGFRDCTRVALGSPAMWDEILSENKNAILSGLASLKQQIELAETALQNDLSLLDFLEAAKKHREKTNRHS